MIQQNTKPPSQRLLRNCAGLFFKQGQWTAYANEATVFSTTHEALRARNRFDLENIQLMVWPERCNCSLSSN